MFVYHFIVDKNRSKGYNTDKKGAPANGRPPIDYEVTVRLSDQGRLLLFSQLYYQTAYTDDKNADLNHV